MKRYIMIIMVAFFATGLLARNVSVAINNPDTIASGNIGNDNLLWVLTSDSVLTISGEGTMPNFEYAYNPKTSASAPWYKYRDDIGHVIIQDGVQSIGAYAFSDCGRIKTMSIPNSVKKIENYALRYCIRLDSITIPNSVESVGVGFLWGCRKLKRVEIPNSINKLNEQSFYDCSGLEEVIIPSSISSIPESAFDECINLKKVVLPNTISSIGGWAFCECYSLSQITIPQNVSSIGERAFYGCSNLDTITCEALTPPTCGKECFYSVFNTTLIFVPQNGVSAYKAATEWSSFPNIYPIGEVIPSSDPTVLASGYCGKTLTWQLTSDRVLKISGYGDMYDYTTAKNETVPWYAYRNLKFRVEMSDSITSIGNFAFSECNAFNDITIPKCVTRIGGGAFRGCSSLSSIAIPNDLTIIDDIAFDLCISLSSVTLPASLKSLGNCVFYNCTSLSHIICLAPTPPSVSKNYITDSPQDVQLSVPCGFGAAYKSKDGWNKFSSYNELCPDTIASGTCGKELTWALTEDSVMTISGSGPMDYESAQTPWSEYVSALSKLIIEEGATTIHAFAFSGCENLASVSIPSSLMQIGDEAFTGCTHMSAVNISNIAAWCQIDFYEEWGRETYSNPLSYAHHLFLNEKEIIDLVVPEGVTSIGRKAFENATSLQTVTLPSTLKSVGVFAFFSCSKLSGVYISDLAAWCSIKFDYSIDYSSNPLLYAHKLYVNKGEIKDVIIPDGVDTINALAFYNCTNFTSLTLPQSLKDIEYGAFDYCTSIDSLVCKSPTPPTINSCFYEVPKDILVSVPCGSKTAYQKNDQWKSFTNMHEDCEIPYDEIWYTSTDGKTISPDKSAQFGAGILSNTYNDGKGIIKFNGKVTQIGYIAFYNCKTLKSIAFPNSVTYMESAPFGACVNLVSADMGDSLKNLSDGAFSECYSLSSIKLGEGMTTIHEMVFNECSSLTSFTIPANVTSVGDGAFAYCTNLAVLVCEPAVAPTLGSGGCFVDVPASMRIIVPCNSKMLYQQKDGWKDFKNNIYEDCQETISDNEIWYTTTDNNTIKIHNTNGFGATYKSNKYVNSGIIRFNGNVTKIGTTSFQSSTNLASMTIPNSVTSIDLYAFLHCTSLMFFNIPENVTKIDSRAFYGCRALTAIDVKTNNTRYSSVNSVLYNYAQDTLIIFPAAHTQTVFTLPQSVKYIERYAFNNCNSLNNLLVEDGNMAYCSVDGVLYDYAKTTLVKFPVASPMHSFSIPSGVRIVAEQACQNDTLLTTLVIPETVETIENEAFDGCTHLTSITCRASTPPTLSESSFDFAITQIPVYVPLGCKSLYEASYGWDRFSNIIEQNFIPDNEIWYTSSDGKVIEPNSKIIFGATMTGNTYTNGKGVITFDGAVTSIGYEAFMDCSRLTKIVIPGKVKTIGRKSFSRCSALPSVSIPDSVTTIESYAFSQCSILNHVVIPDNVKSIDMGAFYSCTSLSDVKLSANLTSLPNSLFGSCQSLKKIDIPQKVKSIGQRTFYECTILDSIVLPKELTTINESAFYNCTSLSSIICKAATPPTCYTQCFFGVVKSIPVFIPCESKSAYKTATGWQDFTNMQGVCAKVVAYGECGKGVYWVVTADSTLTIFGKGEMNSYKEYPWSAYVSNIRFVVIQEGVTKITTHAFYGCASLVYVTISSTVTQIGAYAFYECMAISSITCDATTPPVCGDNCFGGITSSIPLNVPCSSKPAYQKATGWSSFANIIDPCEATEPASNELWYTSTKNGVVYPNLSTAFNASIVSNTNKNGRGVIVFSDNLTTIKNYAFKNCSQLITVTLPSSVTTLLNECFRNCTGLTTITLGDKVNSIGQNVFSECSALQAIYLPVSTPPSVASGFASSILQKVTLIVPCDSYYAYSNDASWKQFSNIVTACGEKDSYAFVGASLGVTEIESFYGIPFDPKGEVTSYAFYLYLNSSYTDEVCHTKFDANGNLQDVAIYKSPQRKLPSEVDATICSIQFEVSGLMPETTYYYVITAFSNSDVVSTKYGQFTTGSSSRYQSATVRKVLRNGQIIISVGDNEYNIYGQPYL